MSSLRGVCWGGRSLFGCFRSVQRGGERVVSAKQRRVVKETTVGIALGSQQYLLHLYFCCLLPIWFMSAQIMQIYTKLVVEIAVKFMVVLQQACFMQNTSCTGPLILQNPPHQRTGKKIQKCIIDSPFDSRSHEKFQTETFLHNFCPFSWP